MAKSKNGMSLEELTVVIGDEMRQSIAYLDGELAQQRAVALQYYNGETVGDLSVWDENRSKVVSRDVADTVEWILPDLLKKFTSGDEVVKFEPQGPEDEEAAKQATEYVNWIFSRENRGFTVLYTNFKDALIQKNGIGKVWWVEEENVETHSVEGMDDAEYTMLLDDDEIEILEHTEYPPVSGPPSDMVGPGAATALAATGPTHDVKYKRTSMVGKCCVEAVPPEEFMISPRAKTIEDAIYVGHRTRKTLSDLIKEGYDKDQVEQINGDDALADFNNEAVVRRENDLPDDLENHSGQNKMVWVEENYLYVDYDGDGIAELRKIDTALQGKIVLKKKGVPQNFPYEGPRPFYSMTPVIQSHKFFGLSIADLMMDLQTIKSVIWRQTMDSAYLANNPRAEVSPYVNMDDFLDSRVGGAIRLLDGADPNVQHVKWQQIPFMGSASLGVLEYLDTVLSNRTGVTAYNQGTDADSLNKTASGITQIMSAAQQRIELIARIFAETGVSDLFKLILYNVCTYQQKARQIRLRNKWVPMDPREWDTEFDLSINVGLGTGNKDQMLVHLNNIAMQQAQAMQAGAPIVTWENIYNTAVKIVENSGLKSGELYWTDPKNAQPQPPKPDPEMLKLQQQAQSDQAKLQLTAQNDQAKMKLDIEKTQAQLQLEREKMQAEFALKQQQMQLEHEMKLKTANDRLEVDKIAAQPQPNFVVGADGVVGNINAEVSKMQEPVSQVAQMVMSLADRMSQMQAEQAQINAALIDALNAPKVVKVDRGMDGKIQAAVIAPTSGMVQ